MDQRPVLRCSHCRLRQFRTSSGACRRCRKPYEDHPPVPHELDGKRGPTETVRRVSSVAPPNCLDTAFAVRLLRQAHGYSQRDLAAKIGCQRTYVSKLENRGTLPTIVSFVKIAAALEVEPWILLYFADPNIRPMEKAA